METRLLIQGQRGMTVCLPINEELAKTLLMLCQVGDRLGDNVNVPRAFDVEVYTPALSQVRKYNLAGEDELAQWGGEPAVKRAQLYYDLRMRGLGMAVLERKDGKLERVGNTITLIEADLTTLLGRLLQRKALEERETRLAERGGRDRRKGTKGREARQRIGQMKQEIHREQSAEASAETDSESAVV